MTYGEKLTQLRKNARLTQAELGDKLGVTAQAVSKWEHDVSQPDLGTLVRISELFGITTDEFLNTTKEESTVVAVDPQKVAEEMTPMVSEQVKADIKESVNEEIGKAIKTVEVPMGYCYQCGGAVYKRNLGTMEPRCLCKSCLRIKQQKDKQTAEQEEQQRQHDCYSLRTKRNRTLFWGTALAAVILAAAVAWAILSTWNTGARVGIALGGLYVAYAAWSMVGELVLSDSVIADIMEWSLTRTIHWPGIIFTFDLDGFIFLVALKILFAILGALAGAIVFALGLSLSLLISGFVYPFTLAKVNRKIAGEEPIDKADLI